MKAFSRSSTAETKIESGLALRVYQKIVDCGERSGEAYVLDGLTASADYDGYAVTLSDGAVSVRVLFHNRVQVEAPSSKALENFRKRLLRVGEVG